MKGTVVEIRGRQFIVGLWWHPVDKNGNQRAVAREVAREEFGQFNAMVSLASPPQVGITNMATQRRKKKLPKILSLACALKMVLENRAKDDGEPVSALMRMPFDGVQWCFCVSNGHIVPNGDFAGAPGDVDRVFEQNMDEGDYNVSLYLESEAETLEKLEELLSEIDLKTVPRIRLIQRPPHLMYAAFIALALIAAGYSGFSFYRDWRNEAERQRLRERLEAQRQQAKQRKTSDWTPPPVERIFPPVWEAEPAANAVLAQCYRVAASLPVIDSGWDLNRVVCTKQAMELRYKITGHGSYLRPPRDAFQRPDHAKMHFSFRTIPLEVPPPRKAEALHDVATTVGVLYELAKLYMARVSVSLHKQGAKAVKGPDGPVAMRAPFREGSFEFSDVGLPSYLLLTDIDLPGLVISSVGYDAIKKTWHIGGNFYASLP